VRPYTNTTNQLRFDDAVIDKLWAHGLQPSQVLAVLESRHVVKRNRSGRRATHLVIGRDAQGRCLAIPVLPTHDPMIWRPVTAWYCKPSEQALLPATDR